MKKYPLISVIIPTYNSEKFLEECLDSVLNQTYPNIEVLIIDGGSTDSTIKIIKTYLNNPNWRLFETSKGVSHQRNIGIINFNGEYVYCLDSDDYFDINFIKFLYEDLLEQGLDIITPSISTALYRDKKLLKVNKLKCVIRRDINKDNFFVDAYDSFLAGPTKLYKKEFAKAALYDENLCCGEDLIYNYNISVKKPFKFGISERSTYYYRKVDGIDSVGKRLNKENTMFFPKFLKILKGLEKSTPSFEGATKILKEDCNAWITNFVSRKIRIPLNMNSTRWYFFINDRSKKRWFYLFPKKYLKNNSFHIDK